ncbi:hypothetical protein KI387_031089, partial [Taxus chinensis]
GPTSKPGYPEILQQGIQNGSCLRLGNPDDTEIILDCKSNHPSLSGKLFPYATYPSQRNKVCSVFEEAAGPGVYDEKVFQ